MKDNTRTKLKTISKNIFNYIANYLDLPETLILINTNRRIRSIIKKDNKMFYLYSQAKEICQRENIFAIRDLLTKDCKLLNQ